MQCKNKITADTINLRQQVFVIYETMYPIVALAILF